MQRGNKHPEARAPEVSYQALLDRESNAVPAALRVSTDTYLGSAPLTVERYLSRDYHEREKREPDQPLHERAKRRA